MMETEREGEVEKADKNRAEIEMKEDREILRTLTKWTWEQIRKRLRKKVKRDIGSEDHRMSVRSRRGDSKTYGAKERE